MGKVSKSTKKFQSKHLKHTLDQRRKEKIQKKRIQGRRGNKTDQEKADAAGTREQQQLKKSAKEEVFKDMSVETFFEKGIEIPKENKKLKKKTTKEQSDEDSSSSEEEEDMGQSMAKLAEKDPEFYKYLEENDKDLLDFAGTNPLDGIDSQDEDEDAERNSNIEEKSEQMELEKEKIELSLKLVRKWKKQLHDSPSLKLLRNIISAFKVAVNLNKEENIEDYKYAITDEKAFHELMFMVLKDVPQAIQKMAPYKIVKGARTLPNGGNVSRVSSIVKSHAGSLLILLNDITNTETAALVLHSVNELMPYLLSYRRILKELIKSIVGVWSTTRELETQIASFAFLINTTKEFKKSMLETTLKTTYSTFIKSCRKTNMRSMPLINFQKNSAAELFGIDEVLGYQVGFEYIRQLAIHLRNTMNATTKKSSKINSAEAYKIVYNWQFCHSLDFWSRVLSFACQPEKENGSESPLRQLIYPLVQVTLGVIRLIPTPQFFPLRFYLIKSLIRLSQNSGVFIPIYPLLSEILTSTAFTKAPKKSPNLAAFDFEHNIKCTQAYLNTKIYQEGLSEQFVDLLGDYFALYCKNIAFPELVTPVIISLRRYIKTSTNVKLNKRLSTVVEKLNQNSTFIQEKRSDVEFGPTNKSEVSRFLNDVAWNKTPLGAYVAVQREVKEEKARLMRESMEEQDKERETEEAKLLNSLESDDDNEDVEMSDA
ncbi:BAD_collapsed_G0051970.mRNA.1.CDS.1 [Saccharomyces cerevisiae]|nr:BAD_HP_G0009330.mRNA.1.CDS.1 [Saccharomyces cerevisiae]CAI4987379.1 BAD_HP_G0056130.mRNA.1.CDS.1 [Saccharomyces cerevisiae]CAI6436913.1 BAD_HP_G0009330.mRNA.1.CDS.1 [Saccharomyces cerevisiae]CAI6849950.1 BAD_HP_G0056130.mRNA.1.CDS.1 [Saccharomyces cerevisiae]CAI7469004.1 BAD_collapsed_G0051970.mRNA.1.CDS.1 [Saccharomyces cerevisiae]